MSANLVKEANTVFNLLTQDEQESVLLMLGAREALLKLSPRLREQLLKEFTK